MSDLLRQCSKCRREWPATSEFFSVRSNGNLRKDCRQCARDRANAWRSENVDLAKTNQKAYYAKNSEKVKANVRQYNKENKEKIKERNRVYREKNADRLKEKREMDKERRREWFRAWYMKHRDRGKLRREYTRKWTQTNRHKKRALKLSLPASFTTAQWDRCLDYFNHCCAACGRPVYGLLHTAHADHWIPLSDPNCPGTIATNMIVLCGGLDGCNQSKHARPAAEWLESKFGKRKAKQVLKRVSTYFAWVAQQPD